VKSTSTYNAHVRTAAGAVLGILRGYQVAWDRIYREEISQGFEGPAGREEGAGPADVDNRANGRDKTSDFQIVSR